MKKGNFKNTSISLEILKEIKDESELKAKAVCLSLYSYDILNLRGILFLFAWPLIYLSNLLFTKIQWFYYFIVFNTVVYYSIVLLIVLFNCLNCSIVIFFKMQWAMFLLFYQTKEQYIYCYKKQYNNIKYFFPLQAVAQQ